MPTISRQTLDLALRIQQASPKPLTQRQAIRRAMWLREQCQVGNELLQEIHEARRDAAADTTDR
jgi:hypothetical protein